MTNRNQKFEINQRMATTGESYAEARRKVRDARSRRPSDAEPEKIHVSYVYTRSGEFEFDAAEWDNALSNERQRMVEQALGEELDADFDHFGGVGIAECVESGELVYTATTVAEKHAEWEADVIETAIRVYAGIEEYEDWPETMLRPIPRDSHVASYEDVEYVVLRRQRDILAVIDIAGGGYTLLDEWPKEIETR